MIGQLKPVQLGPSASSSSTNGGKVLPRLRLVEASKQASQSRLLVVVTRRLIVGTRRLVIGTRCLVVGIGITSLVACCSTTLLIGIRVCISVTRCCCTVSKEILLPLNILHRRSTFIKQIEKEDNSYIVNGNTIELTVSSNDVGVVIGKKLNARNKVLLIELARSP
jgi:hypothetical protein